MKWFRYVTITTVLLLSLATAGVLSLKCDRTPVPSYVVSPLDPNELTTFTAEYTSEGEDEDVKKLQCPIPMSCRVKNGTGIQCVWSSIECIGRWAEEPKLTNPPLTSRSDCKSYSSPTLAATRLDTLKVKYEQSYKTKQEGVRLIKKAMSEGRGCLWGVPGHAMVLCHYDEAADKVCWIDNSDRSLKVQTTTIQKFTQRWDSWILVVYADKDIIPQKMYRNADLLPRLIPIIDRNNPQGLYPKEYIPIPNLGW